MNKLEKSCQINHVSLREEHKMNTDDIFYEKYFRTFSKNINVDKINVRYTYWCGIFTQYHGQCRSEQTAERARNDEAAAIASNNDESSVDGRLYEVED